MSEQIPISEELDKDSFIAWMLIHLMTDATESKDFIKTFWPDRTESSSGPLFVDVEVKVNGIEVKLTKLCETIEKSFQEEVEKATMKILESKINKQIDLLNDIEKRLQDNLADLPYPNWDARNKEP